MRSKVAFNYGVRVVLSIPLEKDFDDIAELQGRIADPAHEYDLTLSQILDVLDQEVVGKSPSRAKTKVETHDDMRRHMFSVTLTLMSSSALSDATLESMFGELEEKVQRKIKALHDNTEFGEWMFKPSPPVFADILR